MSVADLESLRVEDLPSTELPRRLILPKGPGVYFAIGPEHQVLYIGKAISLVGRWRGVHHRRAQLDRLGPVMLAWLAVDPSHVERLSEMERALIQRFDPPLNKQLGTLNRIDLQILDKLCEVLGCGVRDVLRPVQGPVQVKK